MSVRKIAKKEMARLLDEWSRQFSVLVPSMETGVAQMAGWQGEDTSFVDWYRNTILPPKDAILPVMEEMFSFSKNEDGYRLEMPPPDSSRQLIFGIRPCDARALAMLDVVFKQDYEDTYYMRRRSNTVLVGIGCTNPYDSCFCTSLDGGPSDTAGLDLMLTDIGDEFVIEAVTEAGRELLDKSRSLRPATADDEARARESRDIASQRVTRNVDVKKMPDRLLAAFDNEEYWRKIAAKCISCGICTLLCPTCYCFDINDEVSDNRGARYRSLDSCAFCIYTKMPVENPREEKWQRVRNRVCHKYEFYPRLFDTIACTGCGRCIRQCPVNWDITRTLNSIPGQ